MKIREVKLNKFKRFTDLTITGIPQTAKLVILVGPNGSGKTSVFEALNHWYKWHGFNTVGNKDYYFKKSDIETEENGDWFSHQVQLSTYDTDLNDCNRIHGRFYFRTAHRNEPDFTTSSLSRLGNPKDQMKFDTLMNTDMSVSENYQRLV